jgi:hypothetical protein
MSWQRLQGRVEPAGKQVAVSGWLHLGSAWGHNTTSCTWWLKCFTCRLTAGDCTQAPGSGLAAYPCRSLYWGLHAMQFADVPQCT